MASVLEEAIIFLGDLGVFDYLLPFILVFTLLYAIFEKTKVLGTEKIGENEYTKRSLNAMASFTIAMLVIVSDGVVGIITQTSRYMVVLVIASIFFMILVGSFHEQTDKPFFLEKGWKTAFMWIMFIGLIGIFLSALKTEEGESWLQIGLNWITDAVGTGFISAAVFLLVLGGLVMLVMHEGKPKPPGGTGGGGDT